jgi:hypothetical protein
MFRVKKVAKDSLSSLSSSEKELDFSYSYRNIIVCVCEFEFLSGPVLLDKIWLMLISSVDLFLVL